MIQNMTLQVFAYQTSMNPGYLVAFAVIIGFFIILKIYNTWKTSHKTTRKKRLFILLPLLIPDHLIKK